MLLAYFIVGSLDRDLPDLLGLVFRLLRSRILEVAVAISLSWLGRLTEVVWLHGVSNVSSRSTVGF